MAIKKRSQKAKSEIRRIETIGRKIRMARDDAGKSLSEVQADSGVFPASLSRIENGSRAGKPCSATLPTLLYVASSLGIDVADFFADSVTRLGKARRNHDNVMKLVRDNIRWHREDQDMSRGELGKAIGSSHGMIVRIEDGDHDRASPITTTLLLRVADGLGVDPVKLLLPKGARYTNPV